MIRGDIVYYIDLFIQGGKAFHMVRGDILYHFGHFLFTEAKPTT